MGIKIREKLIPKRRRGIYMKKNAKRISVILMLALIFTSIEFMGVFADSEAPTFSSFDAESGYRAVVLRWSADAAPDGATRTYEVYMDGKLVKKELPETAVSWTVGSLDPMIAHNFQVKAINTKGSDVWETKTAVKRKQPVRTGRYILKIKQGGTLKKHAGSGPKKYKLKKGTLYADRFQTGRYIFDANESTYYVARSRVGKKKFEYTRDFNYTRREAENFVNGKGVGSKTGVLIWVNTYTQHVYYFNRSGSRWVCTGDWECSTGTASTPTPSGINGMKTIKKKIKKSNGIKWWSTFNGNAALHGRKKGKKVGKPASNGCVRNPDECAKLIYKSAGKKSKVFIY